MRGALIGETGLGSDGAAAALAVAMLAIMAAIVTLYGIVERKAQSWLK